MSTYDREATKRRVEHTYKRIGAIGDPCVYCGRKSTDLDHVPPLRYALERPAREPRMLIPACRKCNQTLSDRGGNTIESRRALLIAYAKSMLWLAEAALDEAEDNLKRLTTQPRPTNHQPNQHELWEDRAFTDDQ